MDSGQLLALADEIRFLVNHRAKLRSVLGDLLEQHDRQLHMDDCSLRGSACYLREPPEWERAWEDAQEAVYGVGASSPSEREWPAIKSKEVF